MFIYKNDNYNQLILGIDQLSCSNDFITWLLMTDLIIIYSVFLKKLSFLHTNYSFNKNKTHTWKKKRLYMCIKAKYSYLKKKPTMEIERVCTKCLWKKSLIYVKKKNRKKGRRNEQTHQNGNIYRKQNKHMTIQVKTLRISFLLLLYVYLSTTLNSY
jgi:hypothetical protein